MSVWKSFARQVLGREDDGSCSRCPDRMPGQDPAFATAVTALGAKLARVDGTVLSDEYDAFIKVFQPDHGSDRDVRRLFDLARQTTLGFESYARQLARRYDTCPQLLEDVLDGLFFIAASDGMFSDREMEYLRAVSDQFGLSPLVFRRLQAMHLGLAADDPYAILNVAPDASDDALRQAWIAAIAEVHPDRLASRGLPEDFAEIAAAKAAAINAAYDAARAERRETV